MDARGPQNLSSRFEVRDPVPARMLNEHAYCRRLAYLECMQGDFSDNADTVGGRFHYHKLDAESGALPGLDKMAGAVPCELGDAVTPAVSALALEHAARCCIVLSGSATPRIAARVRRALGARGLWLREAHPGVASHRSVTIVERTDALSPCVKLLASGLGDRGARA
jgi:hypothetical protein